MGRAGMSIKPWIAAFSLALVSTIASAQSMTPEVIEVFVLTNQPIQGIDTVYARGTRVHVHVVDDVSRFEAELTALLPDDTADRQQEVGAMIHQMVTPEQENRIVRAWFALQRATELGITKTPAVVFDGNTVLYGVAELEDALEIWRGENG